jgi:4-hydroxy-tetrahydrodipicolinate synthase
METRKLTGVLTFPVTAMNDDGTILDIDAYQSLIAWQIDEGVHGVVPLGSTGEFAYLDADERDAVARATVDTCAGRVSAVIGVSSVRTDQAVAYAKAARRAGADGILLSVPTYYPLSNRELQAHVAAVVSASELPTMLYNNPYTSAVDITPDLLEDLLAIDGIVAVKEASMDVARVAELTARFGDRLTVLGGGFDPYALPAFSVGATGWTTGLANLLPARCVDLYKAAVLDKEFATAQKIHFEILPLANLLVELGLSVAVKAGLRILGRPAGAPRRPLLPLDNDAEARLRSTMEAVVGVTEPV